MKQIIWKRESVHNYNRAVSCVGMPTACDGKRKRNVTIVAPVADEACSGFGSFAGSRDMFSLVETSTLCFLQSDFSFFFYKEI